MFRNYTTFVIGAGASAEFGMPVGSELAKSIKKSALLRNLGHKNADVGDDTLYETVRRLWPNAIDRTKPLKAAQDINEGVHTAVSIDAFIDRFANDPDIALMGKMLIALEIAKAEAESSMAQRYWPSIDEDNSTPRNAAGKPLINPDDTWIGHFFRILCDGVQDARDLGENITIICFNYDRCIEYYLRKQIAAAYRISLADAHEIVMGMNIIHPYGTLGELTLNKSGHGDGLLPFAPERDNYFRLEKIAENIRTYTQQQHEPEMIKKIHDAIALNNVLVFLGFGFNNQNLDLLRVSHLDEYGELGSRNIYSSGLGIAQQVDKTIKRRIMHLLWQEQRKHDQSASRVHIEYGQKCWELFNTHSMNLSSFTRAYFVEVGDHKSQRVLIPSSED
ncbi:hypothetical protein ELI30_19780 [Rhizobium leguminosarum]|uniref:hypothetical protein n=1 Tax=Rhizobium leguminosarum TaxID=384 RepID=UPI00103137D1|nr:hypothetical protein [Rhizobium leguminosarum]TAV50393.1 hypothetical protein ELI32_20480 [Rhizobium leguminosarum]TAV59755.1 hypothetical protein ELI31_19005 [Rhizobium leguminosarum]TAV70803.1 hypothetical protein ELI30_19780 [Rhizobium leguminosarum]TAY68422.1 hypothetical protein ELH82_20670 [Rhizobium leguminosarum]